MKKELILKMMLPLCLVLSINVSAQISLDGYGYNGYISDEAIDTVSGITGVPEGYTVAGFSVSAIVNGFTQTIESRTAKLNAAQRQLMHSLKPGSKIYVEDINLKNNRTNNVSTEAVITLIKDGITAKTINGGRTVCVYPYVNSDDPTKYQVLSFEVETIHPDFVYNFKVEGNTIDSADFAMLTQNGYGFNITNIEAEHIQTKVREHIRHLTVADYSGARFICRSKEYFLKKNAKINFVYPVSAEIDSVQGVFIGEDGLDSCSFKGCTVPRTVQRRMKHTPLYTTAHFTIYIYGQEKKVSVMLVD
ncbi:MAG: hypothetical protein J5882_08460 [Bacteroidales bacterium]|nr:hypothetical protein [Bacteroidales bacterium]